MNKKKKKKKKKTTKNEEEEEEEENKERRRRRRRPEAQNATPTISRSRREPLDKLQPQPPRGRESRSPRAPKNKRHKTNANATTQWPKGRRRTPQAGRSPRAPKDNHQPQPLKERKTPQHAEGSGHQQTNTNSGDQHTHSHQVEEKQNRRGRTTKTSKQKALRGGAEAPNRCGQKARNTKTARRKPRAVKCPAAANGALSLLHRRGRGDWSAHSNFCVHMSSQHPRSFRRENFRATSKPRPQLRSND